MDHLWMARDLSDFKSVVRHAFAGTDERPARRRTKLNKLLTDEAAKIAKAAGLLNHSGLYRCISGFACS